MKEICLGNIKNCSIEDIPAELTGLPYFDFICTDNEKDDSVITLYVGYSETKKIYPQINLFDFRISENIYWTPSFEERRDSFYDNICDFIFNLPERYFNKYTHTHFCIKDIELLNKVHLNKVFVTKDKILYALSKTDIYSIDLNTLLYFDIDIKSKLDNIVKNKHIVTKDFNGSIETKMSDIFKMDLIQKYIVTLL